MSLKLVRTIQEVTGEAASGTYDHLHFGAPHRAFLEFSRDRLGGKCGLAVDAHPARARAALDLPIEVVQGNFGELPLPPKCVRFVTMNNVIPRLESLLDVRDVISVAVRLARDFVYIQLSNFDDEEFLRDHGLKMFYADWSGNLLHVRSDQLKSILEKLKLRNHLFQVAGPTIHSSDPFLHPLDSAANQGKYDAEEHPSKLAFDLPRPVYKSLICLVRLREDLPGWARVVRGKVDALPLPKRAPAVLTGQDTRISRGLRLKQLGELLLLDRRWAYLRYMHLRDGLIRAGPVASVLGVGVGHAYAELALAIEFPHVKFHLTDINAYAQHAKKLAWNWQLENVSFGKVNVLEPIRKRYDFVESVEVLEHIDDDGTAARNMQACARKAVFALVPFAEKRANADENLRKQVWENHEHFRVGYDEADLRSMFENVLYVQGCYWKEGGAIYRARVSSLSDDEIRKKALDLISLTELDIVNQVPATLDQAKGIWLLAKGCGVR